MKECFLDWSIDRIKKKKEVSDLKLVEIRYGLEAIYLSITKLAVIVMLSLIFKIFIEFIIFLILYNIIRAFAFGIHAKNSVSCLIVSSVAFLGIPYISKFIFIPLPFKILIMLLLILFIIIYAPADTKKRPLINKTKRFRLKIIAASISFIYVLMIIFIKNDLISNLILFSLLTEVITILPITYGLLKAPYRNYKNYKTSY